MGDTQTTPRLLRLTATAQPEQHDGVLSCRIKRMLLLTSALRASLMRWSVPCFSMARTSPSLFARATAATRTGTSSGSRGHYSLEYFEAGMSGGGTATGGNTHYRGTMGSMV